jgi:hypothetical protein
MPNLFTNILSNLGTATPTSNTEFISQQLSGQLKNVAVFTIRLLDADTSKNPPLAHFQVKVDRLDSAGKPDAVLFAGRANQEGEVRFQIKLTKAILENPNSPLPKIQLTVLDLDGDKLHSETIPLQRNKVIPPIMVKTASHNEKLIAPIDKWQSAMGLQISPTLQERLKQGKIDSLADLRVKKLPKSSQELSAKDKEDLKRMQAHANLQLISRDSRVNQQLFEVGYSNILDIASQSRTEFIAKVKGKIDAPIAAKLHETTRLQTKVLQNLHTEARANSANGIEKQTKSNGNVPSVPTPPPPCECNCGSAVSPQAYLVDLLDYAVDNIRLNGNRIELPSLEEKFKQPFAALPVECTFADRLVRQVRLCTEVLLNYNSTPEAVERAFAAHPPRAYAALLRALGTSHQELRQARSSQPTRERLAQRLGLAPDDIDRFHQALKSTSPNEQESTLESLFGWQGIFRDPLSTGSKFDDHNQQIRRWQLRGVEWQKNTDDQGVIHVDLVQKNGKHEIIFFKDRDREIPLARGSSSNATDTVELIPENNSGLTGRVTFGYERDNKSIRIAVVPEWSICRKNHLRTLWQEADYPASTFNGSIVDPDIVTETDFIHPFDQNPAHEMWLMRKTTIEINRETFKNAGSITTLLKYPFPDTITLDNWDIIRDRLRSADANERNEGKTNLASLNNDLTPEAFSFLLELWHREDSNREVSSEEYQQAVEVLINLFKLNRLENWKTEEEDKNIRLSAPFFVLSAEESVLNPLRTSPEARSQWRAELERNSAFPLIDPDILSESNFASGSASSPAYGLWDNRRQLVGDGRHIDDPELPAPVKGTLFTAVATIASVSQLNAALTSSDLSGNGNIVFHRIGLPSADLDNISKAIEEGRTLPIRPEQYGLTSTELRALFEVRRLGANADASDWQQVHHILVQAEKRRYLYPQWRIEENTRITISPDIFCLPSNEFADLLPVLKLAPGFLQWRRDERRQRAWRTQLQARIEQEKAIDPELQAAIDAAEEASLPTLRDDLLMAIEIESDPPIITLEERKRWVMNNLLINAFDNGCRKTTRVAQAIETMQLLLWGIQSRQFEDSRYSLESESAETFTEEWQYLGSYATWRSAMFTYLYPENLLLPELRQAIGNPDTDPTKLFQAILKVVSGEAQPPSVSEASDNATDDPQSTEDTEVTPFIKAIYQSLDKRDPQTLEGQKHIFESLHSWRFSFWPIIASSPDLIANWEEHVSSLSNRVVEPDVPLDNETNAFYFLFETDENRPKQWLKYTTPSAFLEDVLYIPLVLAFNQLRKGNFEEALYWFGKVYNFRGTPSLGNQGWTNSRLELYFKPPGRSEDPNSIENLNSIDDWLNDNLNPHRIAALRIDANVRFVILSIIQCLLEYADSEFSKDTSESLARARELYDTARRLLDSEQLGKPIGDCKDVIGKLISEIGEGTYGEVVQTELDDLLDDLSGILPSDILEGINLGGVTAEIQEFLKSTSPSKPRVEARQEIHKIFTRNVISQSPRTLEQSWQAGKQRTQTDFENLLNQPQISPQVQRIGIASTSSLLFMNGPNYSGTVGPRYTWYPAPNVEFCIPRNPVIALLRLRFEASWFKLHNCMNLAGQRREVPAYAAPTDTFSGLPVAAIASTAGFTAAARFVPTLYRYRVLIDRAKQLVALAQQMESTYLLFLEKRDLEDYNIRKARQDLGIAQANISLQDLRVTEAANGRGLADLQWDRANETFNHYEELINTDLTDNESWAIGTLTAAAAAQMVGSVANLILGEVSGMNPFAIFTDLQSVGTALATTSSMFSMLASFERREQEWNFQKDLAAIDQDIAIAQQTLALDRYNITLQEKRISEMSAENASDVVNFLNTKFTNVELYTWMGGIVSNIYRYLLQEATTIAKLAQRQLAFERQETELAVILDDYWTYTDTRTILRGGSNSTDRRGMTGSARLLQDLTRLDQEAFLTDRRKLQLSKTFSLALLDPIAFVRFRESGVLPFSTTLDQFDRDFPGHYLRLIKRVRVSVIALVPPTEGIRATLSSTGISRVVSGSNSAFRETEIRRDPETIAFTAPINATGLFELQEQPEMLLPFESNGVAASWIFSLPRAANMLDYSTIADVLVTIEYTALESGVYRSQVIQQLDRTTSGERPFSFRQQFADAWYDLNNSDMLEDDDRQIRVTFETRRSDFPPNVTDLSIQHVSLYFQRQDGSTDPISVESLLFTPSGRAGKVGGAASTNDGLISTRKGSWLDMQGKQPIGQWDLTLKIDEVKGWFKDKKIEDILFVITFGGTTSAWPS